MSLWGPLALTVAATFSGAAVYVSFVEQPARLKLSDPALLNEWKPSYKRGTVMQASLAVIGGVCGIIAWLVDGDLRWLIGALLLLANWPVTYFVIMPTNNRLMALPDASAGEARPLIERWGTLHAIRSVLGCAATLIFVTASV